MSIPTHLPTGVLPPYIGEIERDSSHSPFRSTTIELATTFVTSTKRATLMRGLLSYRSYLTQDLGLTGFQWVAGSFVEQISREPNDVDVVIFIDSIPNPSPAQLSLRPQAAQDLIVERQDKTRYQVDSYFVDLPEAPNTLIRLSTFWNSLFGHRRITFQWKGMIRLELDTPRDDQEALRITNERFEDEAAQLGVH